ncbi:uncharacterized protein LOC129262055 [Lytechinus pictus]|uniref:uncharacterized protein LOC129262055 n=1 Tax=Lytechinus pictus TaxID=7653 RepID=UPI0030B9ECEB
MEKKARKRNWDSTEKTLLVHLVGDRVDIIEKKRNDFQANSAKIGAWEEIFSEFRARYGERRSLKELREQWKRIKLAGKAEWADFSKKRRMTGGGEPPHQPSDISVLLRDMVPQEFSQIINEYDDDAGIARQNDDAVSAFEYLAGILPGLETPHNVKSCRSEPTLSTITDATSIYPSITSASSHALHSTCIEVTPEKRSEPTVSTITDATSIHPSITSARSHAFHSTRIGVTPGKRSDLVQPTLSTTTDANIIHPSITSASSNALRSTSTEVTPEKRSDLVQPTLSTTTDANIIHPSITSASSNALRSTSTEVTPEKRSDLVQPTLSTTTDANIIHPSITSASSNALRSTSTEVTPVKRNSQTKRRVSTPAATTSSPSLEETLKLHAEEEHRLKIEEHHQRMKFIEDEQRIKLGYLEEQQKVKMEILQMKKKVQQRKLDLIQNQQDTN